MSRYLDYPTAGRMRIFSLIAIVCAVASIAAYLQALHYPFVSDDVVYVYKNEKLAGLPLNQLWRLFAEPYNSTSEFLPLRELSYWFDIKLFGLNPAAFRIHNILLYLLCLPLVYASTVQVWRYFRPADITAIPWVAAVVTALFALQPSHAEAVVWIAGRKDVLCGLFSLLAILLALLAKREGGISTTYAIATLAALFAAMLSKATAVAVAPVIAMLWVFFWLDMPKRKNSRKLLLWPFAALILAAGVAVIFSSVVETRIPIYWGLEAATRSLAILGWLTRLSFSPESRHFFYPVFEDPYFPVMVTLGAIVLAAAVIAAVLLLRKRSLEGFALVAFLLICLPSMQLIPYAPPSLVSDRFVFLAVWPTLLLLVSLMWRLKPLPRTILLLVIALSWGFQTMERPRDWSSSEAFIATDMQAYPGYYMPSVIKILSGLHGEITYSKADLRKTANDITLPEIRNVMTRLVNADDAVEAVGVSTNDPSHAMSIMWELSMILSQPPTQLNWNIPLSVAWARNIQALERMWDKLSNRFPSDDLIHYNAGLSMMNVRRYEKAASHFRLALESRQFPASARGTAYKNLGLALLNNGQVAEAEIPLRAALEQVPPDVWAYCSLSIVYKRTRRFDEAERAEINCQRFASKEQAMQ